MKNQAAYRSDSPIIPTDYSFLAIHCDGTWIAQCRELDVSATGRTPQLACQQLRDQVAECLEMAKLHDIPASAPVDPLTLVAFIGQHQGSEPIWTSSYVTEGGRMR